MQLMISRFFTKIMSVCRSNSLSIPIPNHQLVFSPQVIHRSNQKVHEPCKWNNSNN